MHRLTRLSINNNNLQCLDGDVLDRLPNLHFLSVENNIISSLHGLQRSRSLFELYVGNNDISTTRDIYHLKVRRFEYHFVQLMNFSKHSFNTPDDENLSTV